MIRAAALIRTQAASEFSIGHDCYAVVIGRDVVPKRTKPARQPLHIILKAALLSFVCVPAAAIDACGGEADVKLDKPRNGSKPAAHVTRFVVAFLLIEIGREFTVRTTWQPCRNQLGGFESACARRTS